MDAVSAISGFSTRLALERPAATPMGAWLTLEAGQQGSEQLSLKAVVSQFEGLTQGFLPPLMAEVAKFGTPQSDLAHKVEVNFAATMVASNVASVAKVTEKLSRALYTLAGPSGG